MEAFCFEKETDRQKTTCRHCWMSTDTHLRLSVAQRGAFRVQLLSLFVFLVIQLISYRALVRGIITLGGFDIVTSLVSRILSLQYQKIPSALFPPGFKIRPDLTPPLCLQINMDISACEKPKAMMLSFTCGRLRDTKRHLVDRKSKEA